ncbi:MAG: hypothetical protein V3T54_01330 [Acidobacteriota bacterium]
MTEWESDLGSKSDLPKVPGAVDIMLQDCYKELLKMAPGWTEAMGEPLTSIIWVGPLPDRGLPKIYMRTQIWFGESAVVAEKKYGRGPGVPPP